MSSSSTTLLRGGPLLLCAALAVALLVLGGCGGSVDGGGMPAPTDNPPATESSNSVPDSALASASSFVSYLLAMLDKSSDTTEPLNLDRIGEAPASDTTEASALY